MMQPGGGEGEAGEVRGVCAVSPWRVKTTVCDRRGGVMGESCMSSSGTGMEGARGGVLGGGAVG